ncbi:MAG: SUF system NifU family Fe-S cluster assembly protein [Candidatus Aenigmarchaeota archaeon]|nr:SUF system NifU family Fe-S cluster assembly protein [Candidatus Aenigmarchaeota archaeon]
MTADELYQEIILDHYRHPHNYGILEDKNAEASDVNPLCGDAVSMTLKINGNAVKDIRFSGAGCAISQAAASMLTDAVKSKTIEEVKNLSRDDVTNMLGGMQLGHVRIKCAMLPLKVLKMAVYSYYGKKFEEEL